MQIRKKFKYSKDNDGQINIIYNIPDEVYADTRIKGMPFAKLKVGYPTLFKICELLYNYDVLMAIITVLAAIEMVAIIMELLMHFCVRHIGMSKMIMTVTLFLTIPYEFRVEGFTLCSICKNFVDENTEFVPASHLVLPRIEKEDGSDIYEKTLLVAEEIGVEGYKDFMDKMLMVDYIIQNTDRHLGNFGFIRNVETGKFVGPAPLFDNGTAFWNTAKNGEA